GVGHAADHREAATRRRPRADCNRLLALVARLAQVRMQVNEARRDAPTGRKCDLTRVASLGGERRAEASSHHALVLDQYHAGAVESLAGIEDAAGAQEQEISHAATAPLAWALAPPAAPCAPRHRWSLAPRSPIADPPRPPDRSRRPRSSGRDAARARRAAPAPAAPRSARSVANTHAGSAAIPPVAARVGAAGPSPRRRL